MTGFTSIMLNSIVNNVNNDVSMVNNDVLELNLRSELSSGNWFERRLTPMETANQK